MRNMGGSVGVCLCGSRLYVWAFEFDQAPSIKLGSHLRFTLGCPTSRQSAM